MLANIEAERARLGLSKRQTAFLLFISPQTYSAYIKERRPIPSDVLLRMKRLFDCQLEYLLQSVTVLPLSEDTEETGETETAPGEREEQNPGEGREEATNGEGMEEATDGEGMEEITNGEGQEREESCKDLRRNSGETPEDFRDTGDTGLWAEPDSYSSHRK